MSVSIDRQFIGVLNQAAQEIGSLQGKYLVLSGETLKFSPRISEEVSIMELTQFVNEKLKGLIRGDGDEVKQIEQVRKDLSSIEAEYLRRDSTLFKMHYDDFALMTKGLEVKDFAVIPTVNRQWLLDIDRDDQRIRKTQVEALAFGPEKWKKHFGVDVGEVPPIPVNMYQILNSSCPFWPEKKVGETHLLALIPLTVNGQYFTLKSLIELIQRESEPQENMQKELKQLEAELKELERGSRIACSALQNVSNELKEMEKGVSGLSNEQQSELLEQKKEQRKKIQKEMREQLHKVQQKRDQIEEQKQLLVKNKMHSISPQCIREHGEIHVKAAHWVLMTKAVIPGSSKRIFSDQCNLIRSQPEYNLPNLLPAAVSIFVNHVNSGKLLYEFAGTRCLEPEGRLLRIFIAGKYIISGLPDRYDLDTLGAAAMRIF